MKLKDALGIGKREVISLVGGGGKTTLMFALARELSSPGDLVVTTTTTKIQESEPSLNDFTLVIEKEEDGLIPAVLRNLGEGRYVTVAFERLPDSGKLRGISPHTVDRLAELPQISYVIVEADGAAHKSLKAPNATEPVIPDTTTIVIPVVGIDSLGARLGEKTVFRPNIVSRLTGLALGGVVTIDVISALVTHEQGLAKGSPPGARIVPFINKMDLLRGSTQGKNLALHILARKHPAIIRVVLGQAQASDPVAAVFS